MNSEIDHVELPELTENFWQKLRFANPPIGPVKAGNDSPPGRREDRLAPRQGRGYQLVQTPLCEKPCWEDLKSRKEEPGRDRSHQTIRPKKKKKRTGGGNAGRAAPDGPANLSHPHEKLDPVPPESKPQPLRKPQGKKMGRLGAIQKNNKFILSPCATFAAAVA